MFCFFFFFFCHSLLFYCLFLPKVFSSRLVSTSTLCLCVNKPIALVLLSLKKVQFSIKSSQYFFFQFSRTIAEVLHDCCH
uniref:Putative secreted protein n=1 Tax=Rhipicephalus microplus TaxID=6941 RepID=A0A6M2DEB1_RHIMP